LNKKEKETKKTQNRKTQKTENEKWKKRKMGQAQYPPEGAVRGRIGRHTDLLDTLQIVFR
jgi:hypothetical protein